MSIADSYRQFPDVHPNIILKTEVLRHGITMGKAATDQFQEMDDVCWKGFHFFSYDAQKTVVYSDRVPSTIHLSDGCVIQVRVNAESPFQLDHVEGDFVIREKGEIVARGCYFDPKPKWYDMKLEDGTMMAAIACAFGGELVFVTFNKYCELWNERKECLFCDINATLRAQKQAGEDLVARKSAQVIAEVLKTALYVDPRFRYIYISGGSILGEYQGQTELEFYCTRLNAMREAMGNLWYPATCQIAAQDDEGWKILRATGVPSIQPNIEVWGEKLWQWICPGKNANIGWDEWIKRTIRAVDFWGERCVNPSFVLGVEMAKPVGFNSISEAVKHTAGGWDFLMSHGVLPRYAMWTVEPNSRLAGQEVPSLEFYVEAEKAYAETRWKHNYDPPVPAGLGRTSYILSCLQDYEYYHGSGPLSKKSQEEALRRPVRKEATS